MEATVYVLKLDKKYLRFSGAHTASLVNHPAHATEYRKVGDALYRKNALDHVWVSNLDKRVQCSEFEIFTVIFGEFTETKCD